MTYQRLARTPREREVTATKAAGPLQDQRGAATQLQRLQSLMANSQAVSNLQAQQVQMASAAPLQSKPIQAKPAQEKSAPVGQPVAQLARIHNVPRTSDQRLSRSDMKPSNQSVVCGIRMSYTNRLTGHLVNKTYVGKAMSGQGKHAEDRAKKVIKLWVDAGLNAGRIHAGDMVTAKLNVNKSMCSGQRGTKLATFAPNATKHHSCTDVLDHFINHNGVNIFLELRIMRVYKHTQKAYASRRAIAHLKNQGHINVKPWRLKNTTTGANKTYITPGYGGPTLAEINDSNAHRQIIDNL